MAEIRRLQSQPVFNKPIGVVTPSNAGVKAAEETANLGARMMQSFFNKEVQAQQEKGVEIASQFRVTNDDKEVEYRSLPQGMSKIAQKTAQPLIDKKYQAAIMTDMKKEASLIRSNNKNDPDGFDKAFSTYVNETAKLTDDRYKSFVMDLGSELAGSNFAALYADKVDAEDMQNFKDTYDAILSAQQDLAAFVESGAAGASSTVARLTYDNLNKEIDELVETHGDRMSVTAESELRKGLKRSYGGAMANNVVNKLVSLPEFQDPIMGAQAAANVINGLELAFRNGKTDALSPAVLRKLKQAGFSKEMISPKFLDAESRRIIAGDISVTENTMQEQLASTRNARLAGASIATLSAGGTVSKKEMDNVFTHFGYDTVESLMNDLPQIMLGKDSKSKTVRAMFLNNNSDLPDVVKNIFDPENLERLANTNQLPLAMNLYQQVTKRLNKDGSGVNTVTRGLSDNVMVGMEALSAYRNGVKEASFPEYFQRRRELARDPQRKFLLETRLGKDVKITDFVTEKLGSGASPDEAAFFLKYAEDLVLMHGSDMAGKILQQSADRVFVKSDFMSDTTRSRFAPEKAFSHGTDLIVFKESVARLLSTADKEYTLGEDAFLIADPRHGSVNPIYMLVDENKMPIMSGSKQLLASGQAVIEERMRIRNQSFEEAREAMRVDYQRRLEYGTEKSNTVQNRIRKSQYQQLDDIMSNAQ